MYQRYLLIAPAWRVVLPAVRVALMAGFLALGWDSGSTRLLAGLLLAAALVILFLKNAPDPTRAVARLCLDAAAFFAALLLLDHPSKWILACLWLGYLMVTAALLHEWRETTGLTAVCCVILWAQRSTLGDYPWATSLLLGIMGLTVIWQRTMSERRIEKLARQSVLHRAEAVKARDAERERIANDFHDGPLQSFISLQMGLQVVERQIRRDYEVGMNELEQLMELWKTQVVELREFIQSIRVESQSLRDLTYAVKSLVEAFQKDTGIASTFSGSASVGEEWQENAIQLMHIIREAMTNVRKHAEATQLAVSLEGLDGCISVSIEDNGRGFPFRGSYSLDELDKMQMGPASIKRRVRLLDGEMILESNPDQGSSLKIRVPR